MQKPKLSIVFSSNNELKHGTLLKSVQQFSGLKDVELIVVDKGSTDGTLEALSKFPVKILQSSGENRAQRYNLGMGAAKADLILLNHPRSLLSGSAIEELFDYVGKQKVYWGAFTHKFDLRHPILNFTSWYSNYIRGDLSQIFYLDHCIFINRDLAKDYLIPEVDVFEDTLLCQKLRKQAKPIRLKSKSVTSSVRFKQNGILKQSLLNQILKIGFYLKIPKHIMNKIYERGLNLN